MGQVYKARDVRLNRAVAIKILPPHLSADAEMRRRFSREAETIAALNHPHIWYRPSVVIPRLEEADVVGRDLVHDPVLLGQTS